MYTIYGILFYNCVSVLLSALCLLSALLLSVPADSRDTQQQQTEQPHHTNSRKKKTAERRGADFKNSKLERPRELLYIQHEHY